ncbi:hypothetical protein KY285_017478 [Solanum tuberosum]|nr:hypothetical protein KY285_017478 [Solanum tuberosum]
MVISIQIYSKSHTNSKPGEKLWKKEKIHLPRLSGGAAVNGGATGRLYLAVLRGESPRKE